MKKRTKKKLYPGKQVNSKNMKQNRTTLKAMDEARKLEGEFISIAVFLR